MTITLTVYWKSLDRDLVGVKSIDISEIKDELTDLNLISWEDNLLSMVHDKLPLGERVERTLTTLVRL